MGTTRRLAALSLLALPLLLAGNDLVRLAERSAPSESEGTPSRGRLRHGKRLPTRGANFVAHSCLGALLGRNAVHHRVRDTVVDAYRSLARTHPSTSRRWRLTSSLSGRPGRGTASGSRP